MGLLHAISTGTVPRRVGPLFIRRQHPASNKKCNATRQPAAAAGRATYTHRDSASPTRAPKHHHAALHNSFISGPESAIPMPPWTCASVAYQHLPAFRLSINHSPFRPFNDPFTCATFPFAFPCPYPTRSTFGTLAHTLGHTISNSSCRPFRQCLSQMPQAM